MQQWEAAAPTAETAENESRHGRKRRLVNFWPVRPLRARRRPRLPRKGWVPPDIAEAGDRLRDSAYLANPSWPAYLREIEVGVSLFGVQLLPIAVRPEGSRALSRIRAKSGQTFAESPGEAYLRLRVARACVGP